jgi:predicted TIM-barrel fold metal-dependent hydrolase
MFDLHTHLPPRTVIDRAADIRTAALAAMDRQQIDRAVLMPLDGLYFDAPRGNDDVAAVCRQTGGRLAAACTVNPHDPGAADELDRCAAAGFRAVKLHPWLQGFSPIEPAAVAVARRAAEHRLPLLIHDGTPPYSSPMQIGQLAELVPEATVVLAHGGLFDLWQDAVAAVHRWPNVMVTLCGSASAAVLRQVLRDVSADRVAIGSDSGFGSADLAVHRLAVLRRLLAELPADDAATVGYRNAARWLGYE